MLLETSYIKAMSGTLIEHIASQPLMLILRGLLFNRQRHLRDLAKQYSLSPSGVSDIIRRSIEFGVLVDKRVGNRKCYALNISTEERAHLRNIFVTYENHALAQRATRFSLTSPSLISFPESLGSFIIRNHLNNRRARLA